MDGLDARILRELVWGQSAWPIDSEIRKSFGAMARKLAVDEGTVRNRVRGYHRSGFIAGWRTILNPSLFDGGEVAVWLELAEDTSQDEVFEEAQLLPGAILVGRFHGRGLSVVLRYRDELEVTRQIDLLLRLAHAQWRVIGRVPFPACDLRLTAADRKILRCLSADPRKPSATVARETRMSTRTVRRRLQLLIDHRAAFAFPALAPRCLRGTLMACLFVTRPAHRTAEIDAQVLGHLQEELWHVFHMLPYVPGGLHPCSFNLLLPNLSVAREVLRWAHDLPGVAECRLELLEDLVTRFDVVDDELEMRLPQD